MQQIGKGHVVSTLGYCQSKIFFCMLQLVFSKMEQGYFRPREFYDVAQKYMYGT